MHGDIEAQEPGTYEIYLHRAAMGGFVLFFLAWWLLAAYMIVTSRKVGLASYIASYGFLAVATCAVLYVIGRSMGRERFLVKRNQTVTRYFAFAKPKIYCINEIEKVVVQSGRGVGTSFRIYIGGKKHLS